MKSFLITVILVVFLIFTTGVSALGAKSVPQVDSDPYSLIDQVNALRAANGLTPYTVNHILMAIAQEHAGYMAATGVSHYGVGGSRPFERALAAGYPLAGDLTLGGFFSENITAGTEKSVANAVTEWQGDAPHLNTMLSANLSEIGAGAVVVDGYYYYVIDCGKPTSSGVAQIIPTSMSGSISAIPIKPVVVNTIVPNTPDVTGKTVHIVQEGETLWLIAVSYGIKIDDIKEANYFVSDNAIYPGQKLQIPVTPRPTETKAIVTNTPLPSNTPDVQQTVVAQILAQNALTPTPGGSLINFQGLGTVDDSRYVIFIVMSVVLLIFGAVFMVCLTRMRKEQIVNDISEDPTHPKQPH